MPDPLGRWPTLPRPDLLIGASFSWVTLSIPRILAFAFLQTIEIFSLSFLFTNNNDRIKAGRGGWAVKSTWCSCRGTELSSYHSPLVCECLQLRVTPSLEDPVVSSGYHQWVNVHTCQQKLKKPFLTRLSPFPYLPEVKPHGARPAALAAFLPTENANGTSASQWPWEVFLRPLDGR